MKKILNSLLAAGLLSTMGLLQAGDAAVYTRVIEAQYEDALSTVKDIIKGKGINIAHTLPAGEMLGRTGPDFGIQDQVLISGEIVEFCSASISHKLIAANPENITICPFSIAVYVLTSDPENVHLTTRIPYQLDETSAAAVEEQQELVRGIIDEAADW